MRLGDIVLRLSDTAGIRETGDIVENAGVNLARKKLGSADLILAVFDMGSEISEEDISIAESCRGKKSIAVLNKSDLAQRFDFSAIEDCFTAKVICSASNGEGAEELSAAVEKIYKLEAFTPDMGVLVNERQKSCAERARSAFSEALAALNGGATFDAVTILIDDGENSLLELTGEKTSEAVANEVFSRFCVGK